MSFQDRVRLELDELSQKLEKLSAFISESDTFVSLPSEEKARLVRQRRAMMEYEHVLKERVAAF